MNAVTLGIMALPLLMVIAAFIRVLVLIIGGKPRAPSGRRRWFG